jgi:hypothetical protein
MLRLFTILDANLVSLIYENLRYTKMSLQEMFGKFVSHQMMVNDAKYIDDAANRSTPYNESQTVAFKVTNEKVALLIKWHKLRRSTSIMRRCFSSSSASRLH